MPANRHANTLMTFGVTEELLQQLKVPNRLTGYVCLLDRDGRVRWRGSGAVQDDELAALVAATEALLAEQNGGRSDDECSVHMLMKCYFPFM